MKKHRLEAKPLNLRSRLSALALGLAAAGMLAAAGAMAAEVKTIEPGKLTIGLNGDMPTRPVDPDGQGVEPAVPLGQPAASEGVHVGGMRRGCGGSGTGRWRSGSGRTCPRCYRHW